MTSFFLSSKILNENFSTNSQQVYNLSVCVSVKQLSINQSRIYLSGTNKNKQTNMKKKEKLIIICSVHHFDSCFFCFSRRICFFKFKKLLIIKCLFMFSLFFIEWIGHRNHPFNDERMEKSTFSSFNIIKIKSKRKIQTDRMMKKNKNKSKFRKINTAVSQKKIYFYYYKKLISLFENKNKQESCSSSSSSFEKQKNQKINKWIRKGKRWCEFDVLRMLQKIAYKPSSNSKKKRSNMPRSFFSLANKQTKQKSTRLGTFFFHHHHFGAPWSFMRLRQQQQKKPPAIWWWCV